MKKFILSIFLVFLFTSNAFAYVGTGTIADPQRPPDIVINEFYSTYPGKHEKVLWYSGSVYRLGFTSSSSGVRMYDSKNIYSVNSTDEYFWVLDYNDPSVSLAGSTNRLWFSGTSSAYWVSVSDSYPAPVAPDSPSIISGEWVLMPSGIGGITGGDGGKYKITWDVVEGATSYKVFRGGEYLAEVITNHFYTDISIPQIPMDDTVEYTVKSVKDGLESTSSSAWVVESPWNVPMLVGNLSWIGRIPNVNLAIDLFNKDRLLKGVSSLLVASGLVFGTYDEMQDCVIDFVASMSVSGWEALKKTFDDSTGNSISLDESTRQAVKNYRDNVSYSGTTGSSISVPLNSGRVITPPITVPKQVSIPYNIPLPTDSTELVNKDVTTNPDVTTDTGVTSPTYPDLASTDGNILDTLKNILAKLVEVLGLIASGAIFDYILDFDTPINFNPLVVAGTLFTTKFPFSLPWDFLNSFSPLVGSEWDGVFIVSVPDTPLLPPLDFNIDLSIFNSFMPYVRAFELLLFDIVLIFGARRLLGGAT